MGIQLGGQKSRRGHSADTAAFTGHRHVKPPFSHLPFCATQISQRFGIDSAGLAIEDVGKKFCFCKKINSYFHVHLSTLINYFWHLKWDQFISFYNPYVISISELFQHSGDTRRHLHPYMIHLAGVHHQSENRNRQQKKVMWLSKFPYGQTSLKHHRIISRHFCTPRATETLGLGRHAWPHPPPPSFRTNP